MSKASRLRRRQRRRTKKRPPCSVCGKRPKWKRLEGEPRVWVFYCRIHAPKREVLCSHKRRCWKPVRWETGQGETLRYWCNKHVPTPPKSKPAFEWAWLTSEEVKSFFGAEVEAGILKKVTEDLAAQIDQMALDGIVNVKPMTGPIDELKFYNSRYNTD